MNDVCECGHAKHDHSAEGWCAIAPCPCMEYAEDFDPEGVR